jgi:Tfp pilus assembly protein PilF
MPRIALTAVLLTILAVSGLTGCSHLPRELPSLSGNSKKVETQLTIARLHERSGKLNKALELYQDLENRRPNDPAVNHRLGIVYSRLGDHVESEKHFLAAIEKSPRDKNILTNFGYSLYVRNELSRAEEILRQAIALDADNPRAINNLAIVCGHQGDTKESFRLFRKVGSEADANANLAFILVQLGEGEKAMEHYSRALTLDDSLESASTALIELAEAQRRNSASDASESAPVETNLAASPTPVNTPPSTRVALDDSPIQIEAVSKRPTPRPELPVVAATATRTTKRRIVPVVQEQLVEKSPQPIQFGERRIADVRPEPFKAAVQAPPKQPVANHRPLPASTRPSRTLLPTTRTPVAVQPTLVAVKEPAATRVADIAQPFSYDFPVAGSLD